jgi:phage shock protein PspC (stress-responsive transcriptional regulator)
MKKNISINIGGIIFHIDEDGYERLKNYLDSINKYFSTFEDSKEIIDDIENRIAEIFLSKLSDGQQVITDLEIDELMATMGTVADFEAVIEADPDEKQEEKAAPESDKQKEKEEETSSQSAGYKRLYLDKKRRVIGGVAAGIAHYFGIDPLWIRILILVLFFNILFWGLSGATLIAYIILWIVLPESYELEDDQKVKKLFRNPNDRVFGGVSSGIGAYFGADPIVIRLLFVLSIFLGGAGIILYIILWIITPEAKSITDKMQMQGEPVTLSNIESNVKRSLKVEEGVEESPIVKIILFPFRLIALIFGALAKVLGPLLKFLVEAFRVVFGVVVILIGFSLSISFIAVFLVTLGFTGAWFDYMIHEFPVDMFINSTSWLAATFMLIVFLVPSISLILLGAVIIAKQRVTNAYVGWSLFGVWVVGLIGVAITVPRIVGDFRTENDYREERIYEKPEGIPTLRLNDDFEYSDYDGVTLRLRGHSDSTYKLLLRYESRGSSRSDAEENAKAVVYNMTQEGNDFIFDSELDFANAPFRFQEVNAIFYIPFGETFRMEYELSEILRNTLYQDGYRSYQMDGNDWVIERDGLKCLTCSESGLDREEDEKDDRSWRGTQNTRDWEDISGPVIPYGYSDFDAVKIASLFKVQIIQGDEYVVELKGEDAEDVKISKLGNDLEIKYKDRWDWWETRDFDELELYLFIQAPDLESIELIGGCQGEISGFEGNDLEISLTGASDITADVSPDYLDINLTGASRLLLDGKSDRLDAKIIGASRLDADDHKSEYASIQALGASRVDIYATEELDIQAAGVSTVRYDGTERVRIDSDGLSSVKRR